MRSGSFLRLFVALSLALSTAAYAQDAPGEGWALVPELRVEASAFAQIAHYEHTPKSRAITLGKVPTGVLGAESLREKYILSPSIPETRIAAVGGSLRPPWLLPIGGLIIGGAYAAFTYDGCLDCWGGHYTVTLYGAGIGLLAGTAVELLIQFIE
jgi:hypothetical protein